MTAPYKWHPMIRRGVRGPQRDDPEKHWTPARYIREVQECSFCGFTIPPAKPGASSGTRGTKAYFNTLTKEWECVPCRREAVEAQLAGAKEVE